VCEGGALNDHHRPADFVPVTARQNLRAELAQIVEQHVTTQLGSFYRDHGPAPSGTINTFAPGHNQTLISTGLSSNDIGDLADAFISSPPGVFISELERLGLGDLAFPQFIARVASPLMASLGELWCDDRASFVAVSIATERLRLAIDTFFADEDFKLAPHAPRILITGFEAPQHNFGAFLLGKTFSHAGWLVEQRLWNEPAGSPLALAAQRNFEVFALSVGVPYSIAHLKSTITKLRTSAKNKDMVIALGGVGPSLHANDFADLAVDFISNDAFGAVDAAKDAIAAAKR
jgi:methylmalonyl-CoA mutase cobalamin-binding subunit